MSEGLNKRRKNIVLLVLVLLLAVAGWQALAGKIAGVVQNKILTAINEQLNGRLQVDKIDLTLLGRISLHNLAVYDNNDSLMAKSNNVEIKCQLSDLFSGNLSAASIEVLTVQGAEIWLKQIDTGWNWDNLLKHKAESSDMAPRAKLGIDEGIIHIDYAGIEQTVAGINGVVNLMSYPAINLDLKGRIQQAPISILGTWGSNQQNGAVTINIDAFDLTQLATLVTVPEFRLQSGALKRTKLVIKQTADTDALDYQADGEFVSLTIAGKLDIKDGQGKFSIQPSQLDLSNLSFLFAGQRTEGNGTINLAADAQSIQFNLTLPDADPSAFFSGLTVQRPLSLGLAVSGTLLQPIVTGTFQVPQVSLNDLKASTVSGNLRYANGKLALQQIKGNAYQGQVKADGNVLIENSNYDFEFTGKAVESSAVTDKDVEGLMDFSGRASGDADRVNIRGEFIIRNGKVYGLAFQSLTGNFTNRGDQLEVENIVINTVLGTLYPEQLSREAIDKLNQHNIPTSKEEIKKAVATTLIKKITGK